MESQEPRKGNPPEPFSELPEEWVPLRATDDTHEPTEKFISKELPAIYRTYAAFENEVAPKVKETWEEYRSAIRDEAKATAVRGRTLDWKTAVKIRQQYLDKIRERETPLRGVADPVRPFDPSWRRHPKINSATRSWLYQGREIHLYGARFGEAPGKVLFEYQPYSYIELVILNWSDGFIHARFDHSLSGIRSAYEGKLWVVNGKDLSSRAIKMQFKPTLNFYSAAYQDNLYSASGRSVDDVCLDGVQLSDDSFEVRAGVFWLGSCGHAKSTRPVAYGVDMAHGYHVGVEALSWGTLVVQYDLYGPVGFDPPTDAAVSDVLGAWAFVIEAPLGIFNEHGEIPRGPRDPGGDVPVD